MFFFRLSLGELKFEMQKLHKHLQVLHRQIRNGKMTRAQLAKKLLVILPTLALLFRLPFLRNFSKLWREGRRRGAASAAQLLIFHGKKTIQYI